MYKIISILFLCLLYTTSQAQIDLDKMLAQEFYAKQEYEKASELYKTLYQKTPSQEYYKAYFKTLVALKDFQSCEKLIQKRIKKNRSELTLFIDLGYLYKLKGNKTKATVQFDNVKRDLPENEVLINLIANAFALINEHDYAIRIYEKGAKYFDNPTLFDFQKASIYEKMGDYQNVINTYLGYVLSNSNEQQLVRNALQQALTKKEHFTLLGANLYKRIQRNPGNIVLAELLIWQLIQVRDFDSAFLQVKALDKRLKENGKRVIQLAELAYDEKQYDAAIKAYQYIIDTEKNDYYVMKSRTEILNCTKDKIINTTSYTNEELNALEASYNKLIAELGINARTSKIVFEFAKLQALYLHNLNDAISLLEELVNFKQLRKQFRGNCKLSLGDFYLMRKEPWEATLLYSQVDKAFKDGILGEEARFRNARLSYFKGEFEWAQSQLEILQASTSELIANDALELFVFIQDHLGLDTIITPMQLFAEADLLIFQNKLSDALDAFNFLMNKFPGHQLEDDILFAKAKIFIKQRNYVKAAEFLNNILDTYSNGVLADDALFKLADINENNLGNSEKAKNLFKKLIVDYSGSTYVLQARKRFRKLRGDIVN